MSIKAEIERFILDELMTEPLPELDPEASLFSGGIVDSMGMLRLITFLEDRYGLTIGDGEVGDDNFGTLVRLAAFVDRKQGGRPDAQGNAS